MAHCSGLNLQGIIDVEYQAVSDERDDIEEATKSGQKICAISLTGISADLYKAEAVLNDDLDGMVSGILGDTVDELIDIIEKSMTSVEDSIRNDLILCRPLFDVFQVI